MPEPRRSIVREPEFEDDLSLLIEDVEAADEFLQAAEYVLSADPTTGTRADPGPPELWVLPMAPLWGADVWLTYTFDASTVYFLSIHVFHRNAE
jgi:hypothetical protein